MMIAAGLAVKLILSSTNKRGLFVELIRETRVSNNTGSGALPLPKTVISCGDVTKGRTSMRVSISWLSST